MKKDRAWEIDALRGAAITLMIVYHIVFDLAVYKDMPLDYMQGLWRVVGRTSAISFMVVSGISSTFSKNPIKRGLVVFAAAMLVTAASIPTMGEYYIRFGILHFFAAVMILKGLTDRLFTGLKQRNAAAAIAIPLSVFLGLRFEQMTTALPFLFPLGITTGSFSSYDFYPIFPWLAFFVAGVLIGGTLYADKSSLLQAQRFKLLCLMGRHSLPIYLLHQPLIMLALTLL